MSLKDVLQSETKVNNIKIKVISAQGELSIVGDSSMQAICSSSNSSFKNMVEGQFYMILKPMKQDMNTFVPNEKLKPLKIHGFPLQVKKADTNKLIALLQDNKCETLKTSTTPSSNLTTFQEIKQLTAKSEIRSITIKVITLSKEIQGAYGPYQIAKIKDINKEKMDVNLYSKAVRSKMKRGDIVELKKLKITEYKKEGQLVKRLGTTARSSAEKMKTEIENIFRNIPLGDEKEDGKVLAINDIFPYLSCKGCWKKTYEDDLSCQCGSNEDIHVKDFHCQFYIQTKDEDIKVVHTFRRQTYINFDYQNTEDIQKVLDDKYLEKTLTFEWNVNPDDEEDLKMVDIIDN